MEHELKILPQYFKSVVEGTKTFEIRKNDRGFKVGDTLILKEYEKYLFHNGMFGKDGYFTDKEIKKEVTYILEGGQYGLEEGYCILGLKAPKGKDILNKLLEKYGMDAKMIQETYERYMWTIEYYKGSIKLKNIDLTGLTLVDELLKADEEETEFKQALRYYLKVVKEHLTDRHEVSREHLLEELCDTIQVKLSIAKTIDIDIEEIVAYWNNIHLEKLKDRPRIK